MRRALPVVLSLAALAGGAWLLLQPRADRAADTDVAPVEAAAAPEALVDRGAAEVVRMRTLVETDPKLAAMNAEEARFDAIRAQVLDPWRKAWQAGDGAGLARVSAGATASLAWGTASRTLTRERDGIRELAWAVAGGKDPSAEGAAYLGAFRRVDHVQLDVWRTRDAEAGVVLDVGFDLRGVAVDGTRRNDRGRLDVTVAQRDGAWRIVAMAPRDLETAEVPALRKPSFADATATAGLQGIRVADRSEAIRRGGYALAVADYDGDLHPDVLLGHVGPAQLLRNTGDGFEDVTAAAGIRGETLVKAAAFADLDNDGHRDLVLLRFVEDGADDQGDLVAYRNRGDGTFEHKGDVLTRTKAYDRSMPLAVADFDRNGFLDLYIGFPGVRDFTNDLAASRRTPEQMAQGIWLNDGSWSFEEVTRESDLTARTNQNFPHAALVSDLDLDGDPDLFVIDDSSLPSPVYRNDGEGVFTNASREVGIDVPGFGMAADAGDVDGDGLVDLVVTRIDLVDGQRITASWLDREPDPNQRRALRELAVSLPGNTLYRNRGDGTYENIAARAGVQWAGQAPAGVNMLDYNHDGWLDLYVANGLWSGGETDISSFFLRKALQWAARGKDDMTEKAILPPLVRADPNPVLTMLREFKGDLAHPEAGATSELPTLTFGGHQRNRLFRNNADGTFTEVGYLEGADRLEDGYVTAAADFDGDGRQDLLLRNCDPAPGRSHATVVLLRNTRADERSLTVFGEGDGSNRDGIGAVVTATVGERRLVREIHATQGAIQGEPTAFFGLGDAAQVDALEVRWPSGRTERFGPVKAGKIMLREGRGLVDLATAH